MPTLLQLVLTVFALIVCASSPAASNETKSWYASFGVTTQYNFLGIAQSDRAVIQGGAGYQARHFYSGLWFSEIDYLAGHKINADNSYEIDYFTGWRQAFNNDWEWDLRLSRYTYAGKYSQTDYNYTELLAQFTFKSKFSFSSAFSHNLFKQNASTRSYEIGMHQALPAAWVLSGALGYHDTENLWDYSYRYANVGLNRKLKRVALEFGYYWADSNAARRFGHERTAGRFAASLHYVF